MCVMISVHKRRQNSEANETRRRTVQNLMLAISSKYQKLTKLSQTKR